MRLHLFLFLFLNCTFSIFGQISKSDQKKLESIIGENFILIPTQSQYPYSQFENRFKADLSTFLLGDTVGVSFQNEQLLWHNVITFSEKKEVLKMAKSSYVTVKEYLDFQNWVRDSIARDLIFFNYPYKNSCEDIWEVDHTKEWIRCKEVDEYNSQFEYVQYDISDRDLLRSVYPLNWDKKFSYKDINLIPLISEIYLPPFERLYRMKEFDERKLIFNYDYFDKITYESMVEHNKILNSKSIIVSQRTCTISDPFSWAISSNFERDEFSVLAQTYNKLHLDFPMIGINNPQAKAYCHWKEEILQKELDKKKLPYTIVLSMPTVEDVEKMNTPEVLFKIPAKDYTDQWKITNEEYTLFTESVKDSILREFIYFNEEIESAEAKKFINYTELYFDEGTLEYTPFDQDDRRLGRHVFPLNYSTKIKEYPQPIQLRIDSFKLSKDYTNPRFIYYTNESRSFYPEFKEELSRKLAYKYYSSDTTNTHYIKYGHDYGLYTDTVELNFINTLNQSTNVTGHSKHQQFFVYIEVSPHPGTDNSNPKDLTQGLTYEQALAFYYWKYPIYNPNPKDDWQMFVLPSKEQYEEIQKGKQMNLPEKMVAFPTPVFRYVVHIFPK